MMKVISNEQIYPSIREYCRQTGAPKTTILRYFKECENNNKERTWRNNKYEVKEYIEPKISGEDKSKEPIDPEYENYKKCRNLDFYHYEFDTDTKPGGDRYAIALFSDAHIEETVEPESVLHLNEYNIEIAEHRIGCYFQNLSQCLKKDNVDSLILAGLGDFISGFIHDELAQENSLTPPEAVVKMQSLIVSGLQLLVKGNPKVKIMFIGICGNHSRTTKKVQHSNGYKMSYEWLMYQNVRSICDLIKLPVEFVIPKSEIAVIDTKDNKRYIFIHGFQIKSQGTNTVSGIYPGLQRLAMKWDKTLKQNKVYLGHFHTCVSIPAATVNGSIIGLTAYGLSSGFSNEEPAQIYEVYDSKIGLLMTRKIYCN